MHFDFLEERNSPDEITNTIWKLCVVNNNVKHHMPNYRFITNVCFLNELTTETNPG